MFLSLFDLTVERLSNLQQCNYLKCLLVFKSLNTLAAASQLSHFRHCRQFHSCHTRHRHLLHLLVARTIKYDGSVCFFLNLFITQLYFNYIS